MKAENLELAVSVCVQNNTQFELNFFVYFKYFYIAVFNKFRRALNLATNRVLNFITRMFKTQANIKIAKHKAINKTIRHIETEK